MNIRLCALFKGALLLAFLIAAPASACVTATDVIHRIADELPGSSPAVVEGPIADRVTAGISSVTGTDMPAGGSYVIADLPEGALTYVVRIQSGCATHHGRFPRQLVRIWMEEVAAERRDHD